MSRLPAGLMEKPELDCSVGANLVISLNPLMRQDSLEQFTRPVC